MPSLARRLLPVIAFVIVLCLGAAGILGHARSHSVAHHAHSGRLSPYLAAMKALDLSASVGAIPGPRSAGTEGRSGQAKPGSGRNTVATKPLPKARHTSAPITKQITKLHQPDVLVVGPRSLPAGLVARLRKLGGVRAAVAVDAGRVRVNGVFVNVLGVNPAGFRPFAAGPTARSATLWRNVAAGGIAISYTMGRQDRLTLTKPVQAVGAHTLNLPVAGFGTVGIGGVDGVVSGAVARHLGLPRSNAIIISAPKVRLDRLMARIKKVVPSHTAVAPLVTQVIMGTTTVTTGAAGAAGTSVGHGPGLTSVQIARFLSAAESRIGLPYVWGGAGPDVFDCSGLVQWSLRQAGVLMPRVAADQARTGPLIRLSALRPGDLLFYHTDPTAPNYISHVAIYIGNGQMLQAPQPGMNVEVVPADFGAGFAGAVRIYPAIAAAVAGNLGG